MRKVELVEAIIHSDTDTTKQHQSTHLIHTSSLSEICLLHNSIVWLYLTSLNLLLD